MLSYPFILATARAILGASSAIRGRVFMAPFFASELTMPNLDQIVADTLTGSLHKTYPLSLILPPFAEGDAPGPEAGVWEDYRIQQLFLKQEARSSSGDIQSVDLLTNNSQHTIVEDWHDMKRVAENYLVALRSASRDDMTFAGRFRLSQKIGRTIIPVTRLGTDKLNGVLLTYRVSLFDFCTIEDYPGGLGSITLPTGDLHPAHPL